MKLLTKPGATYERIRVQQEAYQEVRLRPLGLIGIGPVATIHEVPAGPAMFFAGRASMNPIEIDFEEADAVSTCLIEDDTYGVYRRRLESVTLTFEETGVAYTLHGLQPLECLRDNVWKCCIDCYKC